MRVIFFSLLLSGCGAVKFTEMTPEDTDTGYVDGDGDGYQSSDDCDDTDATIHPNADDPEGDDIDSDCDGIDG